MNKRCAFLFGQFGQAADPVNLPHLRDRVAQAGFETILVEHTDSQKVYDFLHGFVGFKAIIGSSLGAGAAPICAGYVGEPIDFVGGFQPSDWDPVMKTDSEGQRYVIVPKNVRVALCFRNPDAAMTGGLGHATYVAKGPTKLDIIERLDVHPGDFGVAQDTMFNELMRLANESV